MKHNVMEKKGRSKMKTGNVGICRKKNLVSFSVKQNGPQYAFNI